MAQSGTEARWYERSTIRKLTWSLEGVEGMEGRNGRVPGWRSSGVTPDSGSFHDAIAWLDGGDQPTEGQPRPSVVKREEWMGA